MDLIATDVLGRFSPPHSHTLGRVVYPGLALVLYTLSIGLGKWGRFCRVWACIALASSRVLYQGKMKYHSC